MIRQWGCLPPADCLLNSLAAAWPCAPLLQRSETPQPSIRDLFGLGSLLGRTGSGASSGGGSSHVSEPSGGGGGGVRGLVEQLAGGGGEAAAYAATRAAVEAAMDEAEQRALWARYRVH